MNDTEIPTKVCDHQKSATEAVAEEFQRNTKRLVRQPTDVHMVLQLGVFAFNCSEHENPDTLHVDFISIPGRMDIPGALQASIKATETLLAALKAKVQ